jgi:uncharacterized repeat protein (TIGR01451 family)
VRFVTRLAAFAFSIFAGLHAAPASAQVTATKCVVATSAAAHTICWFDWTGYPGTGAATFSFTLPDNSTLKGTLTNTGTVSEPPSASPLYNGAPFGNTSYLGLIGKPILTIKTTTASTVSPLVLSGITLTDAQANKVASITMVGADAEATDGTNSGEILSWQTQGTGWNVFAIMPAVTTGSLTNICSLTGTGTADASCAAHEAAPPAAYVLSTTVSGTQTFGMSAVTPAQEGVAFGISLATLKVSKTVASRVAAGDQFTVATTRSGAVLDSASTTGAGTTAATAADIVTPNETYVLTDSAAPGASSTQISQYASTVTCSNTNASSTTTLPAAGASAQSVAVVPAPDDGIVCTFTNTALSLSDIAVNPTNTIAANTSTTDSFTLKNTSTIPGTIAVTTPTVTSSIGSTVTPTGYTFGGTTYATVAALNAAIAAAGTTPAGGSIAVGVTYTTNAVATSSTDTVTLPATVDAGTGTSAVASATETDTIMPLPTTTQGSNCYVATGANKHLLCWLDFAGYAGVGAETFSLKMPDGSTLTGTVTNTGTTTEATVPSPIYAGSPVSNTTPAFGTGAYTGIAGSPIFVERQGGGTAQSPIVLSNLTLTDPNGHAVTTVGMVGADAETTIDNAQFFQQETLYWQSTGAAYTELEEMLAPVATAQVCTLSALAANVTCTGNTETPVDAYLLRSILNTTTSGSPQSIGMSANTPYTQAWAFGIDLSLLTATKTVSSRVAAADQFTVQVARGVNGAPAPTPTGTPFATGSTAGTGTTATATTPYYVIPNETYVWSEAMTAGSTSALSQYATTVTCTNAMPTAGVSQVLPAANASAQSVAIVPQPDAEITCAFTNTAVTMTNVATASTATYPAGATETDSFKLTNTSSIPGTFTVAAPTITPFTGTTAGTAVAPSGYTLTVGATTTTYATLASLNTAIAGMAKTAAGGFITVGVTYATTTGATTSDVVSLPATIASGTGTSAVTTATETDTLSANATLTISKTGTTTTSPGGLIAYNILVGNTGPSPATGALFSDPMPAGVTVTGTPMCATTTGGAVCGAVAVSGTTPQTVTSTLGAFPIGSSVTFTITANAAATCANASSPCVYTNTATISDGAVATAQTSSLSTTVTTLNGLSKTVQNVTQNGAVGSTNMAKPGDVLAYVLTFANNTGQPIYGLSIMDPIPTDTTYYTGNAAVTCVVVQSTGTAPPCAATYTAATTTIAGTLPTKASGGNPLAPGGTVTVTFQVKVN